jgi:Ca2+-transporting ATPase
VTVAAEVVGGRRRGLTATVAKSRLAIHGPNELVPKPRNASVLLRVAKPFADPMALLLLMASATYLFLGDRTDAIITTAALAPVILVTVILEGRAERALERLRGLAAPIASVWRDGELTRLLVEEIVPGDEVFIKEGDVVPADGILLDGAGLAIDESSLTGESQPVEKRPGSEGDATRVLAGTTVLSGQGSALVDTTGPATRYGAIGRLMASVRQPATPLQKRINRLVKRLATVAAIICLLVTAIESWRGHSFAVGVIAGVSLAMAAIPEEFPMVYALYLALGAWRLARDNALVRRLSSVETLGSTTVICTDKTGTLTTGHVEAVSDHVAAGSSEHDLWRAAVLASERHGFDPLDLAIVRAASAHGIDVTLVDRARTLRVYPFDPRSKTVMRVSEASEGCISAAKGSIEGILDMARASIAARSAAIAENDRLAGQGMRILAVASGRARREASTIDDDRRELEFLGLIGFADPIRDGVAATLEECKTAGIRVLIATGDHRSTASSVADRLGFAPTRPAITGAEIDAADDDALARFASHDAIFARTRPEQKHRLIGLLQQRGDVVAMTGDGTNDAPALREADIGIAMGQRGTEVAREAADLILLDDDFSTIVRAVRDGRRIFDNLQRAFAYLVAFHVPLLVSAFALPLLGFPLLLLPVHFVWLEVIVHPTASLVFEADAGTADLMRRAPRRADAELLPPGALVRAGLDGAVLATAVLAYYLQQLSAGVQIDVARGEAIAAMIIGQMALILLERRPQAFIWRAAAGASRVLVVIVALTLSTLWVALHVPVVASVLQVAPLSTAQWGVAIAIGISATLWREPLKIVARLRTRDQREMWGSSVA